MILQTSESYSGIAILDYYSSEDGYDFKFVQTIKINGTYDSYNAVFWDEETGKYNLYYRGYHRTDGTILNGYSEMNENKDVRDIRLTTSTDFPS